MGDADAIELAWRVFDLAREGGGGRFFDEPALLAPLDGAS